MRFPKIIKKTLPPSSPALDVLFKENLSTTFSLVDRGEGTDTTVPLREMASELCVKPDILNFLIWNKKDFIGFDSVNNF